MVYGTCDNTAQHTVSISMDNRNITQSCCHRHHLNDISNFSCYKENDFVSFCLHTLTPCQKGIKPHLTNNLPSSGSFFFFLI